MLSEIREKIISGIIKSKLVIVGLPAIILNARGEILLGKRSKKMAFYPSVWGLPGGIMEKGETFEKAIKREIKEEIGVESSMIKQGIPFNSLPTKECPIQALDIPTYCKIKGIPFPKKETSEVRWFKPKEIKKMKLAYNHKKILSQEGLI